ncbi:ribosome recycling factor [Candidatus Saccharibacteria bacterium]|nr:ribosome recycling factor [Candidatus Saccharibacteria bacterium]
MFDTDPYESKMTETISRFKDELKKIRTGRAHPDMLSGVKVEAYGQWLSLNQVANTTVSGATLLLVTPYDPSTIPAISNAIRSDSSLGLNPSDDGRVVRVPIPPLTEERRKEIVKSASKFVEDSKVKIRNVREDARKDLKTAELPEDAKKRAEKSVDDLTKKYNDEIDALFREKEAEIMKI